MTTATDLVCPDCSAPLQLGLPRCPRCGLRLQGPEAARLWHVRQQIGALQRESDHLLRILRAPVHVGATRPVPPPHAAGPPPGMPPHPAGPPPSMPPGGMPPYAAPPASQGLSGQLILLGIGALLFLSAAGLFLVVIWSVIGVAGQALVMLTLTAAAIAASGLGTARRLPVAAETMAVIGTGLLLLDLDAAYRLGLFGLDRLSSDAYWTFAGLLGAGVLLGADRLMPRQNAGGRLRDIFTFRPVAAVLVAVALWSVTSLLNPTAPASDAFVLATSAGTLVVAVLSAVLIAVAYRFDHSQHRMGSAPWSVLPLAVSLAVGLLVHVTAGMTAGLAPDGPAGVRYGALALLLVLPAILAVPSLLAPLQPMRVSHEGRERPVDTRIAAALGLIPSVLIAIYHLPVAGLVAVAVVLAVVLVVDRVRVADRTTTTWADVLRLLGGAVQALLVLAALFVVETRVESIRHAMLGEQVPEEAAWILPVVPPLVWLLSACVPAVLHRSHAWAGHAQLAGAFTFGIALRDADTEWWAIGGFLAAAVSLALAAATQVAQPAERDRPDVSARGLWEFVALVFAVGYAVVSVGAASDVDISLAGAVLVGLGLLKLAYAVLPRRLHRGYIGAALGTVGVSLLLGEAGVSTLEAHVVTPVLLLAGLGWALWRRYPESGTVLTMGPALVAALGPSLLVGTEEGDTLRMLGVTVLAIIVLLVGLQRHWLAPVLVGGGALGWLALTQGGPLLAHVHAWVLMGLAGATLLTIGVLWEHAVAAGRRTVAWFGQLT